MGEYEPISTTGTRDHRGWYARVFAWFMARSGGAHDQLVAEYKRTLLGDLHGTVLEIGPGAGVNLAYYPADVTWIGVEPNPYMQPYIQQEAARLDRPISIRMGTAEQLPAADSSVDTVVSTLVLCSVADLPSVLQEVRRVLRPGGRFVFIEHVAAPRGTRLRRVQSLIRPAWQVMADGCQPNREIGAALEQAGFAHLDYARFTVAVPIVGPHIAGFAVKEA